jgi:mannose-1-phosphate guanylyltransferase
MGDTIPRGRVFGLVMSGGRGKRLWPFSTIDCPKQFAPLPDGTTLFARAVDRVLRLADIADVFTVTRGTYEPHVLVSVPTFVPSNIVIEPTQRNTGPCVAAGVGWCRQQGAGADDVLLVLAADHYIADEDGFASRLAAAVDLARSSSVLVALGIRPTHANVGYGYVILEDDQVDDAAHASGAVGLRVSRFVEKPDSETAEALLAGGNCLWNSGIYVARVGVLEELFAAYSPALSTISQVVADYGVLSTEVHNAFSVTADRSFDREIAERASNLRVIESDDGWNDLGSWAAFGTVVDDDAFGNRIEGDHVVAETTRCVVMGEGATIVAGVTDLIVANYGGRTLVCHRDHEDLISRLVDELESGRLS